MGPRVRAAHRTLATDTRYCRLATRTQNATQNTTCATRATDYVATTHEMICSCIRDTTTTRDRSARPSPLRPTQDPPPLSPALTPLMNRYVTLLIYCSTVHLLLYIYSIQVNNVQYLSIVVSSLILKENAT